VPGSSAPYEAPARAEIELHTDKQTVAECVAKVVEYLHTLDSEMVVSI
jgi:adenylylsulfate kinase-like enzyme